MRKDSEIAPKKLLNTVGAGRQKTDIFPNLHDLHCLHFIIFYLFN